jgi:hypothetical protein
MALRFPQDLGPRPPTDQDAVKKQLAQPPQFEVKTVVKDQILTESSPLLPDLFTKDAYVGSSVVRPRGCVPQQVTREARRT